MCVAATALHLRLETLHIRLSDVAVYVVTSCLSVVSSPTHLHGPVKHFHPSNLSCPHCCRCVWPAGVMVRPLDLPLRRSRVRLPAVPLSANNLGQVVHTRASVTKQYNLVKRR